MTEPIINYDEHPIDRIYVEWANTLDSAGKDSGPARLRLMGVDSDESVSQLFSTMTRAIMVGKDIDTLKKWVFYGKESDEWPDTGFILNREVSLVGTALADHNTMRILHAVMGLIGEAAEMAEMLHDHLFSGQPLDMENLIEESGDQCWYLALIARACGFATFDEFMMSNKAKLTARYGTVWNQDGAVNRDTTNEMKALRTGLASPIEPDELDALERDGETIVSELGKVLGLDEPVETRTQFVVEGEKRIGPAGELDARTKKVQAAVEKFPTLSSIVSQLSACQYQSRFSESIEDNEAFLALRHYAHQEFLKTNMGDIDNQQTRIG